MEPDDYDGWVERMSEVYAEATWVDLQSLLHEMDDCRCDLCVDYSEGEEE